MASSGTLNSPRTRPIYAIVVGEGPEHEIQCGGYACHHRKATGTLLELGNDDDDSMYAFFAEGKWKSWCDEAIDAETADYVESVVPKFKVDRERMSESCEAWVIGSVDGKPAILVWENSD